MKCSWRYQFIGIFGVGELKYGKIKCQKLIYLAGAVPGGGKINFLDFYSSIHQSRVKLAALGVFGIRSWLLEKKCKQLFGSGVTKYLLRGAFVIFPHFRNILLRFKKPEVLLVIPL